MNEAQVKELFTTAVGVGPSTLPDIDRAVSVGRRRRRTRMAAALSSVAAVTLLLVGVLVAADSSTNATPPPVVGPTGPSSSATPSGTTQAAVSVQKWGAEVLAALPFRDQLTPIRFTAQAPIYVQSSKDTSARDLSTAVRTYADLQYRDGGRTTGLAIGVFANKAYDAYAGSPREILRAHCLTMLQAECDEFRDTPQGAVEISRGVFELGNQGQQVEYVEAANLRPSGQLVWVISSGTPLDRNGDLTAGPGAPGMQDDLDRLVATVTTVPEPPIMADARGAGEFEPTLNPNFIPLAPVSSPTAASDIRIEKSGRPFSVGSGATVTVGPGTACAGPAGAAPTTCSPGGWGGERNVSKVVVPLGSGGKVVVVGNYSLSTAEVRSIVVTIDGRSAVATLVKLGANDEHLAYVAVLPGSASSTPTVEVFDHRDRLLAQSKAS